MDNLGSHKSAAIRQMIKAAGARLWYLPPYSPDLNPIEQAFAKIKHWMRQAQKRTLEDTWRHIGLVPRSRPRMQLCSKRTPLSTLALSFGRFVRAGRTPTP